MKKQSNDYAVDGISVNSEDARRFHESLEQMKKELILKKAIDKASQNGYTGWKSFVPAFPHPKLKKKGLEKLISKLFFLNKEKIVFSHDFAKAFWNKEEELTAISINKTGKQTRTTVPLWKKHLERMVVLAEPVKYLEKFL